MTLRRAEDIELQCSIRGDMTRSNRCDNVGVSGGRSSGKLLMNACAVE